MKSRTLTSLLLLALLLILGQTALSSSLWYVDGVNGSDNNDCESPQTACKTIGHAIALASSGDSIMVAAATYTGNLTINFSLTIIGASAVTTIIDGGGAGTVVTVDASATNVVLSKFTIRNGSTGIVNSGKALTINESTISGNREPARPPNFCVTGGAGIHNVSSTLTINNSTVSGNTIAGNLTHPNVCGGGILNYIGTLVINNSTISGNVARGYGQGNGTGGGIANLGSLTINNSTISGNSASDGGGISGGATLQNSIIANNSGGNCGSGVVSRGYNLSSDGTCNFHQSGDRNNTNPKLGQLGNYGGPTQTIPLLSGSPAIDAGNPSGCKDGSGHLLTTDQRGMPRPDHEDTGGCDMGAFERQTD
jgi:hypothetical protein